MVVLVGVLATGIPRQAGAQAQGSTPQAAPAAQTQGEQPPQQQKKPKDQGEFDIYNEVIKDVQAQNWNKAITDLDTWKQKYPESDFKYDRLYFYMQAYNGARQPAKVLDTATEVFSKDPKTEFSDPKNGPQQIVTVDYLTAANVQHIPNPSPEQLATAEKAARNLLDYTPTFFSAARKPAATSDADWNKARTDLEGVAKGALNYIALRPGSEAMQRKDYDAAIQAYTKALQDHPDSAAVSYALGSALISSRKPENISQGIYQVARAAALDPAKGGLTDPKARTDVENYLKKIYTTIHGSTEGLDQVKQVAVNSPTPPPDFKVKTQAEIALEKEQEFEKTNPQLALWMKIKGLLVDTNGEQYFQSSLKETEVA
ncbi:MAG TPA: tetratricopeptide repeat protein, partial [Bryobacteraceae bacterium]